MPLPVIPSDHLPDLAWSVEALIAQAVLDRLKANAVLASSGIAVQSYEVDDLLHDDTHSPPVLAVVLDATEEVRKGSNGRADLTTIIELYLIRAIESRSGTDTWMLSRVLDYIKGLLAVDAGTLQDPDGRVLSCGLVQFQRVPGALIVGGGKEIARVLRVAYTSTIRQSTRQLAEAS